MSDENDPFDFSENLSNLTKKDKYMEESVERLYHMLRERTEKAKQKCAVKKTPRNAKAFLHAAQDFYYFTEILAMLEVIGMEVTMLRELTDMLSSKVSLTADIPVVDDDKGNKGGGKPN